MKSKKSKRMLTTNKMNKITTLTLVLFSFLSFGQIDCEQKLSKKDYVLVQLFDVLERTTAVISSDAQQSYGDLRGKKAAYEIYKNNTNYIDFWLENAEEISGKSKILTHQILEEMDTIAKLADSSKLEYIPRKGYDKMASTLYPISRIKNYDDRTVTNTRLIGENVRFPKPKGLDIEKVIREYKMAVLHLMADYSYNNKEYHINLSVENGEIQPNFSAVNPSDTSTIRAIINTLNLRSKTYTIDHRHSFR